jgi:glycosyltransferase involved in cell wall biosynthesis
MLRRSAGGELAGIHDFDRQMTSLRIRANQDRAVRVAVTLEQCWHRVPGGTGVAALELLREFDAWGHEVAASGSDSPIDDLEIVGVAGNHTTQPELDWRPPIEVRQLGSHGARLYARWLWTNRPAVERATGQIDVAHATSIIPCASKAPLVVTVHDLAFLHEPDHFTRWGRRVFDRGLQVIRRRADLVLCSSQATMDDCSVAGISSDRLRLVPLGVRPASAVTAAQASDSRRRYGLPERYLLAVGTVEPRKNFARLAEAVAQLAEQIPLVIVGSAGWGDGIPSAATRADVRFLGYVPVDDMPAIYTGASVVAVPSLREGFGLPVAEAMSYGVPVVTSRGTSTEEVAGGAAELVDPLDVSDIAGGIERALTRPSALAAAGRARAAELTWRRTAELTLAAYREVAR